MLLHTYYYTLYIYTLYSFYVFVCRVCYILISEKIDQPTGWSSKTAGLFVCEFFLNVYIPGKPYGYFFCPLWVLTCNGRFFVQLRILVFDGEELFKSFDNNGFGHPPTVSKREISARSGANWDSWSGTQIWPQMLPYFPPNLRVPIKHYHPLNIMLKKKVSRCQHTAPNTASRRDTHTVGTSPMNPRFQENYWPVSRGSAAGHGSIWKKKKRNGQKKCPNPHGQKKLSLWFSRYIYISYFLYLSLSIYKRLI